MAGKAAAGSKIAKGIITNPIAAKAAGTALPIGAETLGLTAAGGLIDGQVPAVQDFSDNALLMITMHGTGYVLGKSGGLAKAGITKAEDYAWKKADEIPLFHGLVNWFEKQLLEKGTSPAEEARKMQESPAYAAKAYGDIAENNEQNSIKKKLDAEKNTATPLNPAETLPEINLSDVELEDKGNSGIRIKADEALKEILDGMEAAGGNRQEFESYLAAERSLELNDIKTYVDFTKETVNERKDIEERHARTVPTMPGGFTPTPKNVILESPKTTKPADVPIFKNNKQKRKHLYKTERYKGNFTIEQTGVKVHFGRDSIGRSFVKNKNDPYFIEFFYNQTEILRKAKYIECEKNDGKSKHSDVVRQDIYLSSAEIEGETYVFRIKIDYKKNREGELYYSYADHETIKRGERPNGSNSVVSSPDYSIADAKQIFKSIEDKKISDLQGREDTYKKLEKQLAGQGYIAEESIPLEEANRIYKALRGKYSSHASKVYKLSRAVLEHYKNAGLISEEAYKNMARHRHFSYLEFDKKNRSTGGHPLAARNSNQNGRGEIKSSPVFIGKTQMAYPESKPEYSGGGIPPVRLSEITNRLAEATGIPVRQGKPFTGGKNVLGLYYPNEGHIRIRNPNDLAVVAHEIGHRLEHIMFNNIGSREAAAYRAELEPLATPGEPVAEGFAEFIAKYVVSPEEARAKAPKFYDFFEKQAAEKQPGNIQGPA
ncbi:MAG: hypothetical protein K5838_08920 [Elusimicrobiales bacterium]|nr:hypothetical protein [Elusimicrobiales bacterium]